MYRFELESLSFAGRTILENVSIQLHKGETLCILGPSGCGKTTLLNALAGIETRASVSSGGWVSERPEVGYLFQEPRLLPWRTVYQNLHLVESDSAKVMKLLEAVGLEAYADYYPSALSLGMERRVALARCLLLRPQLVLMDEALASLDKETATEMRKLIQQLVCDDEESCLVYVTHEEQDARELADKVLTLGGHTI